MTILKALDRLLLRIIQPVLVILGLMMALGFIIGIAFRTGMNTPTFGLEEIILFGVMWFYMLGAVLASRNREHLSADLVDVFTDNPKVRHVFSIISTVVSIGVCLFFVYCAFDLFMWGIERRQVTPVFSMLWVIAQSSLLFAAVVFLIYLIRDLVLLLQGQVSLDRTSEVE